MNAGGNSNVLNVSTCSSPWSVVPDAQVKLKENRNSDFLVINEFLSDTAEQQLLDEGPFNSSFSLAEASHYPQTAVSKKDKFAVDSGPGISQDVNVNVVLSRAAFCGNLKVVKACLNLGATIEFRDGVGRTAVHYAVAGGSLPVLEHLIATATSQRGVSVDENCAPESVTLSLKSQASCNTPAASSQKPMSSINERDVRGWSPLHIAVCRDMADIAAYLLDHGADLDLLLSHNCTPCRETPTHSRAIHFCAIRSNPVVLRVLLRHGANPCDKDLSDRVGLHYAAARGKTAFTKELLEAAPEAVQVLDCHSRTPLHVAALRGFTELVELFIKSGAPIASRDIWDLDPYQLALTNGHSETAQAILHVIVGRVGHISTPEIDTPSTKPVEAEALVPLNRIERVVLDALTSTLQEPNVDQLARCIRRLGSEMCLEKLEQTITIQKQGGIDIPNGTRKKTAGGIFLSLIQNDVRRGEIAPEDWGYITAATRERHRAARSRHRQRLKVTLST